MASTFTRINSVVVDPLLTRTTDFYVDPSLQPGGANAGALATELNPVASTGALFRGMPVAVSKTTGKIVPINLASVSANAFYAGVSIEDITAYVAAKGTKIALVTSGKIRSYAGGAMAIGDPVKADTSAAFSGFVKFIAGTDDPTLNVGNAFPINDGSDGNAPTVAIAQGDQIFVTLK